MLRGRRAAIAAALAIAAVGAVTAGCGGGSTGQALALDPVAAAATKTLDAGPARMRFAIAFSSPQLGRTLRMRGTGAIDGTSAKMTLNMGSMFRQAGLPSGLGSSGLMAQLSHASVNEIALEQGGDYVIYMRLGLLPSSRLPGGKQWFKLDLSKIGKSAGLDLESLFSGSQFEPNDLLGMLEAEGAKVRRLGSATLDGTATTHYRVTIDTAKALQAKGLTSPLLQGIAARMKTTTENVWIGKDGLVRRVQFAYSLPKARLAMTIDLYDYGAHISIAAPPSSEVFDATQLAQRGIGNYLH
jgi:hypothetical protein